VRVLTLVKRSPLACQDVYGADLMCQHVVRHLAQQGHRVAVLTAEDAIAEGAEDLSVLPRLVRNHPNPSLQPEQWSAVHKLQFLGKARHNYTATRRALREFQPEVVYVSDLELLTGSPLRAVQEAGVPLVFHAHDYTLLRAVGPEPTGAVRRGPRRALLDWFLCPPLDWRRLTSSPLLAVSSFMADQYRAIGWQAEQVRVVPNGIDDRFFREGPREFPRRLSVLLAGRCVPDKGLHLAVEAVGLLAQRGLRVELHLLGAFQSQAYQTEIADLAASRGVTEQIVYRGYVPPAQMPEEYGRHACTWMPSAWQEPFGLVSVESQAAGTPVVVSRVGGLPETLQDGTTGLVVPPGDARALAEATESLLGDRDRWRAMSDAGREFARTRFRASRMVREVETCLVAAASPGVR
jgi:glycosyltransferase involved in cell wall biosynthesis